MADYSIAISVKPTGLNETIKSLGTFEKIAEKSVQTAEALAVSLTNLSKIDLSQYKTLFASAIANAQSLTKETGNVIHNLHSMTEELNRSTEATGRLNDTAGNVSVNINNANTSAMEFGTTMMGIAASFEIASRTFDFSKNLIQGTVQARSEIQQLERQLGAVLGSEEKVQEWLPKLRQMANTTPNVDTEGAVKGVSTFMRMGYAVEEAESKMKTLANTTAYYGGTVESVKLALVQFEQMANKNGGWGEDIRSLTNHIPGIRQLIMDKWGTTDQDELKKLGVDTGKKLVEGIFEAMDELPEVDGGISEQFSQLEDSIKTIKADLGEAFLPTFNKAVDLAADFAKAIKSIPEPVKKLGANLIVFSTVGSGLLLGAMAASKFFGLIKQGTLELKTAGQAVKGYAKNLTDLSLKENLLALKTKALTFAKNVFTVSIKKANTELQSAKMREKETTLAVKETTLALEMARAKLEQIKGSGLEYMRAKVQVTKAERQHTEALKQQAEAMDIVAAKQKKLAQAKYGKLAIAGMAFSIGGMYLENLGSGLSDKTMQAQEDLGTAKGLTDLGQATKELKKEQIKHVFSTILEYMGKDMATGASIGGVAGGIIGSGAGGVGAVPGAVTGSAIGGAIGTVEGAVRGAVVGIMENKKEFSKLTKEQRDGTIDNRFASAMEMAEESNDKAKIKSIEERVKLEKLLADAENARGKDKKKLEKDIEIQTKALNSALAIESKLRDENLKKTEKLKDQQKLVNENIIEVNKLLLKGDEIGARKKEIEFEYNQVINDTAKTEEERTIAKQKYDLAIKEVNEDIQKQIENEQKLAYEQAKRKREQQAELTASNLKVSGHGDEADLILAKSKKFEKQNDPNATDEEKYIAENEYKIAENQYNLKQSSKIRDMETAQATFEGNGAKAKEITALKEYEQISNDITKSLKEKWTAYYKYMTTLANNQADIIKKSIQKQKESINELIQKRKQNTDNVIAELEKERNARNSFKEMGQEAVLTTTYIDNSLAPAEYSDEEIRKAQETVSLREQIKENNRKQVSIGLYGNDEKDMTDRLKSIENMEKYISENNVTGQAMLGLVQNVSKNLSSLYNILNNANRKAMNW